MGMLTSQEYFPLRVRKVTLTIVSSATPSASAQPMQFFRHSSVMCRSASFLPDSIVTTAPLTFSVSPKVTPFRVISMKLLWWEWYTTLGSTSLTVAALPLTAPKVNVSFSTVKVLYRAGLSAST